MHRIAVLALDNVVTLDLGIPSQVFSAARDANDQRLYRVHVATPDGRPIRATAGFSVVPDYGPELLETADTVIVPGVDGVTAGQVMTWLPTSVLEAFQRVRPGTRIMSICTGSFVLAALGLLDDRPATTHWAWADAFRTLFPKVRLDPDVLFVDDGDVLTSAGVAAGIDLCLHVVRRDHGSEVANRAARRCVVPPWRDGGQSQFIERPMPERSADGTAATRTWILGRLEQETDLAAMASHARMSVRTFTRRFRDETGVSPGRWLLTQRVHPTGRARPAIAGIDGSADRPGRRPGRFRHRRIPAPAPARDDRRCTGGLPPHLPRSRRCDRANQQKPS